MIIEQPHGYLRDADGLVVLRFGNWETGQHNVADVVESVDYVKGPNSHTEPVAEKYKTDPQ
jgi:hypothetical protein